MSMLTDTIEDARKEMDKTVEAFRHELARVRTGRASTALVENLQVNYYGSKTPLRQLAGLSAPEPRLIVITPVRQGRDARYREGNPDFRPWTPADE